MTWDKTHHYPESIGYKDISIALNEVDSWIDLLNAHDLSKTQSHQQQQVQNLSRMEVPKFNGNSMKWVEFVIKFKELVHDQVYLTVNQKFIFRMQHVEGEAKRAIQVFSTNKNGYILALKWLKYMFGQKSQISQAHISKLTRGKPISNDDDKSLLEYY